MRVEIKKFQGNSGEWNEIASAFSCFSAEQSWEWGEAMKSFGWEVDRILFASANNVCGAASVLKKAKFRQFFCYSPRGPLANYDDLESVCGILENLKKLYPKSLFIKINPDVRYDKRLFDIIISTKFFKTKRLDLFTETIEILLEQSEVDLWNRIRPRFRSYMRKSQKILKVKTCVSGEFIPAFSEIYADMLRLKRLGRVPEGFFEKISTALVPAELLKMRAAYHDGRMLAGIVLLIANKTALYKWGAASRKESELHASHLLHWDSILWAKRNGLKYYDLGGINLKENSGVAQFKKGFGGLEKCLIGEFDFSERRIMHRMYELISKLR